MPDQLFSKKQLRIFGITKKTTGSFNLFFVKIHLSGAPKVGMPNKLPGSFG
jgi:hypothetical protein